jgi:hypothetical protein
MMGWQHSALLLPLPQGHCDISVLLADLLIMKKQATLYVKEPPKSQR